MKLFLEDIDAYVGISDDQTVVGQTVISFSDYLGDRRIITTFQGIESFSEFNAVYADLSGRLQWNVQLFDDRTFFVAADGFSRGRTAYSQLGLMGGLVYPFSETHRAELSAGYVQRDLNFQSFARIDPSQFTLDEIIELNPFLVELGLDEVLRQLEGAELDAALALIFPNGVLFPVLTPRQDDYPIVQAALVGDNAVGAPWGGISGRRWRVSASYAEDLDAGGELFSNLSLELRQYLKLTPRSGFAVRLWGSFNEGNAPTPVYFGGLDTVRGFDFRSLVGDNGFFANVEFRFPLFEQLSSTFLPFGRVRGILFVDVGGAWFNDLGGFDFWDEDNNRLQDGVASYGYGFSVQFLGVDLNFDFAKRTDFDTSTSDFKSSFWIGTRF